MRRLIAVMCVLGGMTALMGCDWSSGGGVTSWNSSYNWVNFSGVYRGLNGGILVTDYTSTPGAPGVTNSVLNETVGTTTGSSTVFNGVVNKRPVIPGSFSVSTAGYQLQDNGDGTLSGSGATGSIDYGTGAWSFDLGGSQPFPDAGQPIRASYQYTVSGTSGSGAPGRGSTGKTVYSFTVFQEGQLLQITDNNGAVYSGNFGSVRSSGGGESGSSISAGSSVIAQFVAEGVSAANQQVKMVGTFQGVVSGGGDSFSLADRRMFGTWIEAGGRTGDINGQASPVSIIVPTETVTVQQQQ